MSDAESCEREPVTEAVPSGPMLIEPVTCLACGCLCDDLVIVKDGARILDARNACSLGKHELLQDRSREADLPEAIVDGQPVEPAKALDTVAGLLAAARAPLVLGLTGSSTETVRSAVALADRIGALIEPVAGRSASARIGAFQRVGRITATLGEVKNRADVVVFWGADPVGTHPRHWERFSVEPHGRFVPEGRQGRTVIVVDHERTATFERADLDLQVDREKAFATFWTLRALVQGKMLDTGRVQRDTGLSLESLNRLVQRLTAARYGALFLGGRLLDGTMEMMEAVSLLVRDLNRHTRFVVLGMGEPGNVQGAEAAITWQTGFPSSVDLASGFPRSLPGTTSAETRLVRGEADLALIVGKLDRDAFSEAARATLQRLPTITIANLSARQEASEGQAVWLSAAIPGLDEVGTATRVDGISLRLRPVHESRFPTEREWIERLLMKFHQQTNSEPIPPPPPSTTRA